MKNQTSFWLLAIISSSALMIGCNKLASESKTLSISDRMKYERGDDPVIEKRINELLSEMTLAEKIGQMTQLNSSTIVTEAKWDAGTEPSIVMKVDTAKLGDILRKHHVGSFLNGIAIPPQEWYTFYKDLQEHNLRVSRLKIPIIYGIDHMHGPNYVEGATIFPHGINMAATFNNAFAAAMARVTTRETADLGHQWLFGPDLDLGRTPLWGRFYETLGESPYVSATMGSIYVKAVQSESSIAPYKVAASAKHFLAYSDPKSGWDRTPAEVSDQTLYEMHLPSFRAAVDAGVETVMVNSAEINGIPVHASYDILTKLLRDDLKFKGVTVTDWEDIIRMYRNHRVAENEREATFMSIQAGIDMAMTPYNTDFCDHMMALVEEGRVSQERIDLSVSRVLRMKLKLGLFENPLPRNDRFDRVGSSEHQALALEAARESIVLMRNENSTLPLKVNEVKNILVAGPLANLKAPLGGGWTLRWITSDETLYPDWMQTPYTALQQEFGASNVSLAINDKEIRAKAGRADAVLVFAGEVPYAEGFGSIVDINLPDEQMKIIEAALATKKPVVLVMISGRPRIITSIYEKCSAVLFAGWPGFQGATAIAEIVSGKVNPSGKLSFNYPAFVNRLVPHNHKWSEELLAHEIPNPIALESFGTGLSYTNYVYSNLHLSDTIIRNTNDEIMATITIKNDGALEGSEAALWFLSDEVGTITRPVKELKYYEKKTIKPGESVDYKFVIKPLEHLWFPDKHNKQLLEDGYFKIIVGDRVARFKLERPGI